MFTGKKILIVDDAEINRDILSDMLSDNYYIMTASDGVEAIEIIERNPFIDLILLDINMPKMNGLEVLQALQKQSFTDKTPIIMISGDNSDETINRCYDLGATDYIKRPFDIRQLKRRVENTLMVYSNKKYLESLVVSQIYEKEKYNTQMLEIISDIVALQNGESGIHTINIRTITNKLLEVISETYPELNISSNDIYLAATASALHDIGKILIPQEILNKPGKLTEEEFNIMKEHTMHGYNLLKQSSGYDTSELMQTAAQICRWHHERYDGKGYPDGLEGDEIPLVAQVVGLADAYDALTSNRCYKSAYSCEEAINMIVSGQCGAFNPEFVECLLKIKDKLIKTEDGRMAYDSFNITEIESIKSTFSKTKALSINNKTAEILERERTKNQFFAELSDDIRFEYSFATDILNITEYGKNKLGLKSTTPHPLTNEEAPDYIRDISNKVLKLLENASKENPKFNMDYHLKSKEEDVWYRIIGIALFEEDSISHIMGKLTNINEEKNKIMVLEKRANNDSMTGLLNKPFAEKKISKILEDKRNSDKKYLLAMIDLNKFKEINDTYGHDVGDEVIIHVAEKLKQITRATDIVSRFGGDEYVLFIEYKSNPTKITNRILEYLAGTYKNIPIGLSMGVTLRTNGETSYEELFKQADTAMYAMKKIGISGCRYFEASMELSHSILTDIDKKEGA